MGKEEKGRRAVMLATLLFGGFLSLLNETILNVALSQLMGEMSVSANTIQWLSTGYVLVVAMVVPMSAFLMRTVPTRRLYLGAMGAFLLGTVVAAFARSFPMLLVARVVQASGTGLLAPLMITVALAISPHDRQGSTMALCTCAILVGPAAGPIVSGLMVDVFGWRFLFIMLVPLELICMVSCVLTFTNVLKCDRPAVDIPSFALSSAGFSALVFGVSELTAASPARACALIVLACGLLVLFARRQSMLPEPMLDVSVLGIPAFVAGLAVVVLVQMIQFSFNVVLPMVYEASFGASALSSALALLPSVVACALVTPLAGRIFDRRGGRALVAVGLAVTAALVALVASLAGRLSMWGVAGLMAIAYAGIGVCWSPNQSYALARIGERRRVHGVTIINTCIQLGSALGTPLLVGVMSAGEASAVSGGATSSQAALVGLSDACLISAGVVGMALVIFLVGTRRPRKALARS